VYEINYIGNPMIEDDFKYDELTTQIIACAFAVHKILGNGFQELIYQRALEMEMKNAHISFLREYEMPIYYQNEIIGSRRVDFLVNENISVELKAITDLEAVHLAQAKNYLEAYNLEIGLLLNFGQARLQIKRLINKKYSSGKLIPKIP
jgi:GxxExxY protein